LSTNFPFNVSFINITIANYSQVLGQFGTVIFIEPNVRSVISSVNGSTCTATVGAPQTTYGSSTLTVTASVSNQCSETRDSSTLSTGAIIGIAVGAAVGGILVALAIVLIVRCMIQRDTLAGNKSIRMKEMGSFKG
jgi:hypothetical protein